MVACQRQHLRQREAQLEQAETGPGDDDIGRCVRQTPLVAPGDQQVLPLDGLQQRDRDATPGRQLVEAEELLGLLTARLATGHGFDQRLVGRVEVAPHEPPDRRQRESLRLQLTDAVEPGEMAVVVERDAPGPTGWVEQTPGLVEAHGVDRDLRPGGELLHAVLHDQSL